MKRLLRCTSKKRPPQAVLPNLHPASLISEHNWRIQLPSQSKRGYGDARELGNGGVDLGFVADRGGYQCDGNRARNSLKRTQIRWIIRSGLRIENQSCLPRRPA